MAESEVRMPPNPPTEQLTRTNPPVERWVGFVNHVPLVGTSANMVDGFIALLQGDQPTAEDNGYHDFIESAGIHQLDPQSILQNHGTRTVMGVSNEVSERIINYITTTVRTTAANNVALDRADLRNILHQSFNVLRRELGVHGVQLPMIVAQRQRANRREDVFNNALLGLYGSIINLFIQQRVIGDDSRVSDAFQGHAPAGDHINLTTTQRRNIRTWVVEIPDDVVYIPINNNLFGHMIEHIRNKAAEFMHLFRLQTNTNGVRQELFRSLDWMIRHRAYLNLQAAEIWLATNADLTAEFHATEDAVKEMLWQLDPGFPGLLHDFVNDLIQAGATFR